MIYCPYLSQNPIINDKRWTLHTTAIYIKMINTAQSNSRIYMIILLFLGLILCLQFPGDGFLGKDDTLLDSGQNSQQCTRSKTYSSPDVIIEVVQNAVLKDNIWHGQLRKLDIESGHSEEINFEIDVTCKDSVLLQFYTNTKQRIYHQKYQEMHRPDCSSYNVTFVQRPQLRVELRNPRDDQILFCISLPKIQSSFQFINVQRMTRTKDINLSLNDGEHSIWRIETMTSSGQKQIQPSRQPDPRKDMSNNIKIYNKTDGEIIQYSNTTVMYNYIHGGHVLPLYDCHDITKQRNMFGLTISLDSDGKAEGELKISRNNVSNTEDAEKYLHFKIKVKEGNCLKMYILHGDDMGEPLFIDTLHFYGLYGHPDSFVIDKGKRYKLEDNPSKSRRITNRKRIYSFKSLHLDVRTSHTLSWTYF